ncbi:MAG: hypothetical protein M3018_03070 [Actinomycetota bacterium]|nr:hypothetical protein [Actinomycetota bacterium]
MSTALLIVVILAAAVLVVIVGGILLGMRTQHMDRGTAIARRGRGRRRAAGAAQTQPADREANPPG